MPYNRVGLKFACTFSICLSVKTMRAWAHIFYPHGKPGQVLSSRLVTFKWYPETHSKKKNWKKPNIIETPVLAFCQPLKLAESDRTTFQISLSQKVWHPHKQVTGRKRLWLPSSWPGAGSGLPASLTWAPRSPTHRPHGDVCSGLYHILEDSQR